MTSLLQQHAYKGRVKALSEAVKAINEIEPVFDVRGHDVTASIREEQLTALRREHEALFEGNQSYTVQKAPSRGLVETIMFYLQTVKAKKKYRRRVEEFQDASARARHEQTLEGVKERVAGRISPKVIDELLNNPSLSSDTKRVVQDMRKTSLEASGAMSHLAKPQDVAQSIQQRIWSPREFALFEQTQNQLHLSTTGTFAQQTADSASQQSVPPWMADAGTSQPEHVMVQGQPAPTGGKHRRTGTFGNVVPSVDSVSVVSTGGSSGYDASSSSHGSIGSGEDDVDLVDIDAGEVLNSLMTTLRQERFLESLDL